MLPSLKAWSRAIKRGVWTLWLAARDPSTPLCAKILAGGVAAYALSPIDLIPDFVPVLGLLDDLMLVPLGIWLVRRLIPAAVLKECRARAAKMIDKPMSRGGAAIVIALWLTGLVIGAVIFLR